MKLTNKSTKWQPGLCPIPETEMRKYTAFEIWFRITHYNQLTTEPRKIQTKTNLIKREEIVRETWEQQTENANKDKYQA